MFPLFIFEFCIIATLFYDYYSYYYYHYYNFYYYFIIHCPLAELTPHMSCQLFIVPLFTFLSYLLECHHPCCICAIFLEVLSWMLCCMLQLPKAMHIVGLSPTCRGTFLSVQFCAILVLCKVI